MTLPAGQGHRTRSIKKTKQLDILDAYRLTDFIQTWYRGITPKVTFNNELDGGDFDQRSRSKMVTGQGQMFP